MLIKDIPMHDRPREKMFSYGSRTLVDYELVAILLNTGTKNKSVIELSKEMLKEAGSLKNLIRMTPEELELKFKGLGRAKIAKLIAAFELAIRLTTDISIDQTVKTGKDVYNYFKNVSYENIEKFYVLVLKANRTVTKAVEISSGDLTSTVVSPREVFKVAIDNRASSIILVHNHPSGSLKPSEDDKKITKTLIDGGKILKIPVLDHIIITIENYFSFFENNLLF